MEAKIDEIRDLWMNSFQNVQSLIVLVQPKTKIKIKVGFSLKRPTLKWLSFTLIVSYLLLIFVSAFRDLFISDNCQKVNRDRHNEADDRF